jgi:hypothetical protein
MDGWFSKNAPKETLDFMKVWLGKNIQTKLASEGLSMPMVKGTAEAIQNPRYLIFFGGWGLISVLWLLSCRWQCTEGGLTVGMPEYVKAIRQAMQPVAPS